MKKIIGTLLISYSVSIASQVEVFIDSSGSIASIGAEYVLSKVEEVQEHIKNKGIESVKVYAFDDNVKLLSSLDGYMVNKDGNTDFKGIASKIKESPADIETIVIVSDGKVPNRYTKAYKEQTIKSFKDIRNKGVKVCFLSLYRDVLEFPKQISDVVGTANDVEGFIDRCFPQLKKETGTSKVSKNNDNKNNTSEIDPTAFVKEVLESEKTGTKEVISKDGRIIINIFNKSR